MNFRLWIKIAWLFLVRSKRSTAVLTLMVLVAVSTLIFLSSLAVGITDAMIRNSVGLYSGHISGTDLSHDITRDDLKVSGVTDVLKRIPCSGRISIKDRSEAVNMIQIDPDEEKKITAIWKKVVQGQYPKKGTQEICPGYLLAQRLNIKPGDRVMFSPYAAFDNSYEMTVSGIFRTNIDLPDRDNAFCPMDAVPTPSSPWDAAVFLEKGMDPESVIKVYHATISDAHKLKSWKTRMPDLLQLIDLNYLSMSLVMVLVFAVVSLGIACAFVIFILKNMKEYGIMKAMGVTWQETAGLIVAEVILLNLVAVIAGIFAGIGIVVIVKNIGIDLTALTSHNQYFAVSGIIFPRLTAYSLWLPPLLAFAFGILASIWPAILVARKKAVEILRII